MSENKKLPTLEQILEVIKPLEPFLEKRGEDPQILAQHMLNKFIQGTDISLEWLESWVKKMKTQFEAEETPLTLEQVKEALKPLEPFLVVGENPLLLAEGVLEAALKKGWNLECLKIWVQEKIDLALLAKSMGR